MNFDLTNYLSKSVEGLIKDALKSSLRNPKGTAFLMQYIKQAKKAIVIREEYEKQGRHIPPFLIASITSSCNLFCKGCYARENKICGENRNPEQLSTRRWEEIFQEAERIGVSFILLAGGEPLMRPDIIQCAGRIPEIIFPVFTNGTLISDEILKELDIHRNLIPIVSIEGNREQTDERRGAGTYDRLQKVLWQMHKKGILYGVSITVTTGNLATVTEESYIRNLYDNGCRIVFYIEYVPITKNTEVLAPTDTEREQLEKAINVLRKQNDDVIFISFPGDEKSTGGCLAAGRGFFHINPVGDAEPCPFSPYSDTNLLKTGLLEALDSPLFQKLHASELLLQEHIGGCTLFSHRKEITDML